MVDLADANCRTGSGVGSVLFVPGAICSGVGTRRGELLVLAVLLGHLAFFNYIGVKSGKNVSNVFAAIKVTFLVFFVVAGLLVLLFRPEIRVPMSVPAISARRWFDAILLLVYGYGGFEGALFVGGESTNPERDTPIALLLALVAVSVIYTTVQFVTIATLPGAASSVRPLSDAARRFLGPTGATAMALAALFPATAISARTCCIRRALLLRWPSMATSLDSWRRFTPNIVRHTRRSCCTR